MANSPHAAEYTRMVETIGESLRFMETLTGSVLADINRVDFFTSHEGLHLLLRAGPDPAGAAPPRLV